MRQSQRVKRALEQVLPQLEALDHLPSLVSIDFLVTLDARNGDKISFTPRVQQAVAVDTTA